MDDLILQRLALSLWLRSHPLLLWLQSN